WTIFERPEVFGAFGNYLHAGVDLGIARAALRDAKDLVRRIARPGIESTVDRPADDPLIIQEFGELALRVRTAAALLHEAGDALDAARAAPTVESAAEASVAVAAARAETDRAAVSVASDVFALIGARASAQELNLHRHWRNARTHTLHDPRRMKVVHIGNHALNDVPPPPSGRVQEEFVSLTHEQAVEAARGVAAVLAKDALDRDRANAEPVAEARLLRDAGLPALLLPASVGGAGLGWATALRVVREIAVADGSIAQLL